MLNPYSTLPVDREALLQLIDGIRAERGTSRQTPALPFSPYPGTGNAGWIAGPDDSPRGWGWIRRQTGKRAVVEIDAFDADRAAAFEPLLTNCREQAQSWELGRLVAYIPEGDVALATAYSQAGFTPGGKVCELYLDLAGELTAPAPPEGYFLKPYHELRHLPTLAALLHRAYHDRFSRPEHETDGVTVETVRAEIDADADAEIERDYFILFNDFGKGVAVVRCRGLDWIDGPGVVPEERENGLHLPLLAAALHQLRSRGAGSTWLTTWDDDPAWIDDYRESGFNLQTTKTCWQKKLT